MSSKKSKDVSLKRMKRQMFLLGIFKIPMIGYVRPRLLELNEDHIQIKIRLGRRTKNHFNSMYFGALTVGADLASGWHAYYHSELRAERISFAFKSAKADFLMRAETDVVFESNDGQVIRSIIDRAIKTKERINQDVNVIAKDDQGNTVATFVMTISVKMK
jgi:acyl-coenzyme A thioesterase PaaI-like protein